MKYRYWQWQKSSSNNVTRDIAPACPAKLGAGPWAPSTVGRHGMVEFDNL